MPTASLAWDVVKAMIRGTVKSVMMLLKAVRITERATLPPASFENRFEERDEYRFRMLKDQGEIVQFER